MNAATEMLDGFFDRNELLVYTEGKSRSKSESKAQTKEEFIQMVVAVLMDESSASASEIFAGAMQDHDRGVIIGRRSFGKGLVQEQNIWPNGGATRLTIARYYTPSGRCIQKPYSDGSDNYNEDYYHRYESGEMLSKDSIDISDSSVFYTDNGRVVYGSGGIIPDIFVPIDTSHGSGYLNTLLYNGVIYDFAFNYADVHREELLAFIDASNYVNSFQISGGVLEDFKTFSENRDIPFDSEGFKRSERIIKKRIKAYIARNIWGAAGFYPIWNADDKTVNAAVFMNAKKVLSGE